MVKQKQNAEVQTYQRLSDDLYEEILLILKEEDRESELDDIIKTLYAADIAILLERVPEKKRLILKMHIPEDLFGKVLLELHDETQEFFLNTLTDSEVADAVESLPSDEKVDIVQNLNTCRTEKPSDEIEDIIDADEAPLLVYEEDSAGGIMQIELLALPGDWCVSDVLEYIREHNTELPEYLHRIFVVGYKKKHIGSISLSRLVRTPLNKPLNEVIKKDAITVKPETHQEDVARLFEKYDLFSCAVLDENDSLLGVITIDDILDVVIEEHDADVMRAAGLEEGYDLFSPMLTTSQKRFPWLFINLLTAALASFVIAQFEASIEKIVALAVLMPIVASMGGNAGTQTMTVAIRGIALDQLTPKNAIEILWNEVKIGGFNGLILALILSLGTVLWYGDSTLGLVIMAATLINHILAAFAGLSIPILLKRLGKDPAVSSGVLLTTVTDVGGFLSFLGLASFFLL